jgi:hypothetical protein
MGGRTSTLKELKELKEEKLRELAALNETPEPTKVR